MMVIAGVGYRTTDEARHRRRELEEEYPLLANPGSWASIRRTDSGARALDEYRALNDYIEEEGPRERSWAARAREAARDPRNLERIDGEEPSARRSPDRDLALRTIETIMRSRPGVLGSEAADRLDELVRRNDPRGLGARYLTAVADPDYNSAFGKIVMNPQTAHLRMTPSEHAAVQRVEEAERERAYFERGQSLTGAQGGFAVPFELDPSIILTSSGVQNPLRQLARVISIAVDEWRGVSSAGVTAAYEAELAEVAESTATLVQPTISTEKAHVFVPYTIEIGQDWPDLQESLTLLFADAKDTLEAQKFATGTGTNEPFGVLTGTTNTVPAAAGQTFTLANLYSLKNALPPRYRGNGAFVGDGAILDRIRQFDTVGSSAAIWVDSLADGTPARLLGRPVYEASEFPDTPATGSKFLLYGDFKRYVIVDRIGLSVEVIPHLFGANRRPTGQRGLYAYWRNSAKVVDANGFRALIGVA